MEAVASPTPEADPNMSDQITDALMACAVHADAAGTHPLVGWIVMRDQPDCPDGQSFDGLVTEPEKPAQGSPQLLWAWIASRQCGCARQ
jgi:hypothetical protein